MGKEPSCTRVLVADDLPEVLEQVRELLRDHCEVVGTVANGQQALSATMTLNPDILILDISMPILNGFEVAGALRESNCTAKVVFYTMHEDRDFVDAAFSCGASGYVLKSRASTDLLPAVQSALQHRTFTSPFRARVGIT